jgi:hypothetical protein
MWLFTTLGFFSCTEAPLEPGMMQIRARTLGDIQALKDAMHLQERIIETPGADYRWRLVVTPRLFKNIMVDLAERVTYGNFKNAVHDTPGQEDKAGPYLRVWATMNQLQRGVREAYDFEAHHEAPEAPREPDWFTRETEAAVDAAEVLTNPREVEGPAQREKLASAAKARRHPRGLTRTLLDVVPQEFARSFDDTPAYQLRHVNVLEEFDGREVLWPGPHKNVMTWWKLANGKAVGWNENPARGWSFPVITCK